MRKNKFPPRLNYPDIRIRFDKRVMIKGIILFILLALAVYFYQNLKNLDFFRVHQVFIRKGGSLCLAEKDSPFLSLAGKNIFAINLEQEAQAIARSYPSYKKIRLIRFMPNMLLVDFLRRKPLACIKSYRTFYIDESLILFELPKELEPQPLPLIYGLDKKIAAAKYGSRFAVAEIIFALEIIKESEANRGLKDYAIKSISLENPNSASIILVAPAAASVYTREPISEERQPLEIRLGEENLKNKLALLATLLGQVKNSLGNIKYIDLRFKEPVMKFKNLKDKP